MASEMELTMDTPSLTMNVADINVCHLPPKKKSASSPSLRQLDQMSLCSFPSSVSVYHGISSLASSQPKGGGWRCKRWCRKRMREVDTMSVQDFDSKDSKKCRPLSKVSSMVNKIIDTPLKQATRSFKHSMPSYSKESTSASLASKHCLSLGQTTPKSLHRRYLCHGASKKNNESSYLTLHNGCGSSKKRDTGRSHLPDNWIGLMGVSDLLEQFSKDDIKRQEAIYSIFKTETEMVHDLKMVINIFFHPLLRLNLLSAEEHCKIFSNLQVILNLHEDLVSRLEELKSAEESVDAVGAAILEWTTTLSPYTDYCANLVVAKQTLEAKKHDPAFQDFLQRCLDSEFSRKIELWTFLDSPRSRIMKYPILLKEVKKRTPSGHVDIELLSAAMVSLETQIKEIDRWTGLAKCRDVLSRLDYLHDEQRCAAIEDSEFILCSGVLRTKNNTKLHVFLLNKALVLTRPSSRTGTLLYQVYRQPIPLKHLVVDDVDDCVTELSGNSFRGTRYLKASSTGSGLKHVFQVSCSDPGVSRHTHTLQANGDFDKKAWMDAFKGVVEVSAQ